MIVQWENNKDADWNYCTKLMVFVFCALDFMVAESKVNYDDADWVCHQRVSKTCHK